MPRILKSVQPRAPFIPGDPLPQAAPSSQQFHELGTKLVEDIQDPNDSTELHE